MTFAEVIHHLIDKSSWFTEEDRTAAHAAVTAWDPDHAILSVPLGEPPELTDEEVAIFMKEQAEKEAADEAAARGATGGVTQAAQANADPAEEEAVDPTVPTTAEDGTSLDAPPTPDPVGTPPAPTTPDASSTERAQLLARLAELDNGPTPEG